MQSAALSPEAAACCPAAAPGSGRACRTAAGRCATLHAARQLPGALHSLCTHCRSLYTPCRRRPDYKKAFVVLNNTGSAAKAQ